MIILLTIKWFLHRVFLFFKENKIARIVLITALAFILVLIVFKSCRRVKLQPKLNEQEIQESISAVEEKNDKKLKEILADSDARVLDIDTSINEVEAKRQKVFIESGRKYQNMTTNQLAEEIEKRR